MLTSHDDPKDFELILKEFRKTYSEYRENYPDTKGVELRLFFNFTVENLYHKCCNTFPNFVDIYVSLRKFKSKLSKRIQAEEKEKKEKEKQKKKKNKKFFTKKFPKSKEQELFDSSPYLKKGK